MKTVALPIKLAERIGILYAALVLSDGLSKQARYLRPVWDAVEKELQATSRAKGRI